MKQNEPHPNRTAQSKRKLTSAELGALAEKMVRAHDAGYFAEADRIEEELVRGFYGKEPMKILFLGEKPPQSGKFLANEEGIIFFPSTQQHRDIKLLGLSYEDDSLGNAVAGIILVKRIEIGHHKNFSDQRIRRLWHQLKSEPDLAFLREWQLFYGGQEIT